MSYSPGDVELARAVCHDGHLYIVRPMEWTLPKVREFWERVRGHKVFRPDLLTDWQKFAGAILGSNALWFECVDTVTGESVGGCYLTDMRPSPVGEGLQCATWHGVMWDSKVSMRRPIIRAAIRTLVRRLRIHRLQAEVPARAMGVVRAAKRLGFREEGVMRQERWDGDEWQDVVLLSLLANEVSPWEG